MITRWVKCCFLYCKMTHFTLNAARYLTLSVFFFFASSLISSGWRRLLRGTNERPSERFNRYIEIHFKKKVSFSPLFSLTHSNIDANVNVIFIMMACLTLTSLESVAASKMTKYRTLKNKVMERGKQLLIDTDSHNNKLDSLVCISLCVCGSNMI